MPVRGYALRGAAALVFALVPFGAHGQESDTLRIDLEELEVTAIRLALTAAEAPLAVAIEVRGPIVRATEPGESLEGILRHIPGLWVNDRENFALGERLSIRGMGARAGFGVRGLQVVLDGNPLTMPDGQSAIAIIDPAMIRRSELIRGPASTLSGNASGGILLLSTIPDEPAAEVRLVGGSFGLARVDADWSAGVGDHRAGLALSHLRREGFRDHSAFVVTRGRGFGRFELGRSTVLTTTAAFEWAPHQQHPGALTAEELAADPRQAQANFVAQQAGKDSRQGQFGAHVRTSTVAGTLTGSGFVLARRLQNPLPFAYIDLYRQAGGARLALEREDGPIRWSVGVEAALQRDDRQNWVNDQGNRGAPLLGQLEGVSSAAAFGHAYSRLGPLTLSAGARVDRTRFEAEDRLQAAGDQSGRRVLGAFSPAAGVSYRAGSALVFLSVSSAFETPTTTELVNRPGGAGGFNPDLQPQRTRGVEAGIRGSDADGKLFYDAAVFQLNIRDQLAAFEGEDGRTYFRNVEATTHRGLELYGEWHAAPGLRLSTTYAWSRFIFDDASGQIAGNRLPGVPEHRIAGRVHISHRNVFGYVSALAAGPTFADDANSAQADGFMVVDLRLGYAGVRVPHGRLLPFLQIRNLFDAHYAGSVAINARVGRYFEPAAGRSLQFGLSLALDS